jgi:hypothetical protein
MKLAKSSGGVLKATSRSHFNVWPKSFRESTILTNLKDPQTVAEEAQPSNKAPAHHSFLPLFSLPLLKRRAEQLPILSLLSNNIKANDCQVYHGQIDGRHPRALITLLRRRLVQLRPCKQNKDELRGRQRLTTPVGSSSRSQFTAGLPIFQIQSPTAVAMDVRPMPSGKYVSSNSNSLCKTLSPS